MDDESLTPEQRAVRDASIDAIRRRCQSDGIATTRVRHTKMVPGAFKTEVIGAWLAEQDARAKAAVEDAARIRAAEDENLRLARESNEIARDANHIARRALVASAITGAIALLALVVATYAALREFPISGHGEAPRSARDSLRAAPAKPAIPPKALPTAGPARTTK